MHKRFAQHPGGHMHAHRIGGAWSPHDVYDLQPPLDDACTSAIEANDTSSHATQTVATAPVCIQLAESYDSLFAGSRRTQDTHCHTDPILLVCGIFAAKQGCADQVEGQVTQFQQMRISQMCEWRGNGACGHRR